MHEIDGIRTIPIGSVEAGTLKSSIVVTFGHSEPIIEFIPDETRHQSFPEVVLDDKLSFNVKNIVMNDLKRGFVTSSSKGRSYKGNCQLHRPGHHHAPP